jgi:hypothetical protein
MERTRGKDCHILFKDKIMAFAGMEENHKNDDIFPASLRQNVRGVRLTSRLEQLQVILDKEAEGCYRGGGGGKFHNRMLR